MMRVLFIFAVAVLLSNTVSAGRGQQKTKGFINPKAVAHFNRQLLKAFETIKNPLKELKTDDGLRHLDGMTEDETCESDLMMCQTTLAACTEAQTAPKLLFIQMGSTCILRKTNSDNAATYELAINEVDDDTYVFTDRPLQIEDAIPTSGFIQAFDETFSDETGGKPNAAFTFVHADSEVFEGPVIAVQINAMSSEDGSIITYVLEQSESQAADIALDDFFASADEVSFQDCSIFIDSAIASVPCSAHGTGYVECLSQGCLIPTDPSTTQDCCNELDGYSWLLGCAPTATDGCCKPDPDTQCVADGGYTYCPDMGCVRPWEPSTTQDCCNGLDGYQWLLGCTPTASQGCCKPISATPAPTPLCSADGGYSYCSDMGCVRPWEPSTTQDCCIQLGGDYAWLLGCTPTATEGCCSGGGGRRRNLKGGAMA